MLLVAHRAEPNQAEWGQETEQETTRYDVPVEAEDQDGEAIEAPVYGVGAGESVYFGHVLNHENIARIFPNLIGEFLLRGNIIQGLPLLVLDWLLFCVKLGI